ncbi:hypothetical protein IGJ01_000927 [Enterococcus sp. AZ089]|uniref:hypothetical protein n=1 Tax=Enterococcus sp. AZ089 TaxID=2774693 RepID=UPI003D2FF8A9
MKKRFIYVCVGGLFIFGVGSTFFLIHEKQQLTTKEEKLTVEINKFEEVKKGQEALVTSLKEQLKQVESEVTTLKKANEELKNNDSTEKGNIQLFQKTVTEAFGVLFNYEPDSFQERKNNCAPYLSDKLMKQYFKEGVSYGDSNGVSSELEKCSVYLKSTQNATIEGLVVVTYRNKIGDSSWNNAMNIFDVHFDPVSKKITFMQNLGSSFNQQLFEE